MTERRHAHRWERIEQQVDFFGQWLTVDIYEQCKCGAMRDVARGAW